MRRYAGDHVPNFVAQAVPFHHAADDTLLERPFSVDHLPGQQQLGGAPAADEPG
jgi:hypothetical protein